MKNPDDPARPTTSPNTVYSSAAEALSVIRKYNSPEWQTALNDFIQNKGKLVERYNRRKKEYAIPMEIHKGQTLYFSPGKHSLLQVKVVTEFRKRFCPNTKILYVGDTAQKMMHIDKETLAGLNIPMTKHDKLPDVVLYDAGKSYLFLIEAVTSHGPVSPKRQVELEAVFKESPANRIYISAFLDFKEFKRHIDNIAWDTEVWIESNPDHMIHFNGPKFFTLYDG